uniref:SH2 domain-containing protein 4A n=1 Tax=Magallana gigas TaxID=29159 RepID=K1QVL8_MAGGI
MFSYLFTQEQVRRYNEFEKKNQDDRIPRKPKKGRMNVDFLLGKNGKEWVWVMGEQKNDKSIDEMIELEIQESALKEAEREIEEIRKPTKHFPMVDCNLSIAEKLIGDFSSRKRAPSCGRGVAGISDANINRHISTKLTRPRGRCKQCKKNGRRSDTFFGCSICNVHLCRGACFQAYHTYHHLLME